MFPLIETIACENGQLLNLEYHQSRMERSIVELTGKPCKIDILKMKPLYGTSGRLKCRMLYDSESIIQVDYSAYKVRPITSLRIIRNNEISYNYKSANRKKLDMLASRLTKNEDMILVKSGLVHTYFTSARRDETKLPDG